MNECECGTQTLDHTFDCPAYVTFCVNKELATMKELSRHQLREQVTSQHMRLRAVAQTNGHGGRPSITP